MKRAAQDNDNEDRLQRKAKIEESGAPVAAVPSCLEPEASDSEEHANDTKPMADAKSEPSKQRKPKNFAERLMRVLQDGVGKDTLWWTGDGKAVAIHSRNLKEGDLLSEHFKVKDYSVFIRNCNRWGFRRTVQYPVDQGVIAYQCSLFQMNEPHLVHHMRMDSDVQDVFVRHRDSEGSDAPFDPKRARRAGYAPKAGNPASPAPAEGQWPAAQKEPLRHTNAALEGALDSLATAAAFPSQSQTAAAASTSSLLQSLSGDQLVRLVQGTGAANLAAANPPAPTPDASDLLGQLLLRNVAAPQRQQLPPSNEGTPEERLLDKILTLSEEYLNHPMPSTHANSESIRMAMQILKLQGEKYKEEKAKKQKQVAAVAKASNSAILDALRTRAATLATHPGLAEQLSAKLATGSIANDRSCSSLLAAEQPGQLRQGTLQQLLAEALVTRPAPTPQVARPTVPTAAASEITNAATPEALNQLMRLLQENRPQNIR